MLGPVLSPDNKVRSGVSGLDELLLGGFSANHVYLVEGTPGTGKTTMAVQFAMEGARSGETVLYVTLSETTRELREVAKSHDWNIDGINIFEVTGSENPSVLGEEYTVFHSDEVEMAATIEVILNRAREVKASRVVIDSLAELRLLSRDSGGRCLR